MIELRCPVGAGSAAEHRRYRNRPDPAGPVAAGQRPVSRLHGGRHHQYSHLHLRASRRDQGPGNAGGA